MVSKDGVGVVMVRTVVVNGDIEGLSKKMSREWGTSASRCMGEEFKLSLAKNKY